MVDFKKLNKQLLKKEIIASYLELDKDKLKNMSKKQLLNEKRLENARFIKICRQLNSKFTTIEDKIKIRNIFRFNTSLILRYIKIRETEESEFELDKWMS